MEAVHASIQGNLPLAWAALLAAFFVLAKCADLFVESSVSLAGRLRIPKLVIGIVLVSLATTAPELSVSVMAALRGNDQIAMGNAIGSIICNTGLGLSLCALFSCCAVPVIPQVLRTAGGFLCGVALLFFLFVVFDGTLSRPEGYTLLALFWAYAYFLYRQHRDGTFREEADLESAQHARLLSGPRLVLLFAVGLGGIIVSSDFIITSAVTIARSLRIPDAVIAVTLVALGTSIPEVATCVSAARKNHGALAVGNILGANIMNVCWVAGASAAVHPLTLGGREIGFMFPSLFVVVGASLLMLWRQYRLTRRQGFILLGLYLAYLAVFPLLFPPRV